MKRWQRWSVCALVVLVLSWATGVLYGIHLSDTVALRVSSMSSDRLRIVLEAPTWFGKSVLFEDLDRGTFGVAHLKRTLGLFWRNGGGTYGYALKPGQPLETTGYARANSRRTQQFVIGIKAETPIQSIAIGSEAPDPGRAEAQDDLKLEHVQSLPKVYQTTPVVHGYALLVADELTAATYTFHAFDANGKLVADQLYAHAPRWVR